MRTWPTTSAGKAGSLEDACELVRAGSSSVCAVYTLKTFDSFCHGHALNQRSDALAVSVAAPREDHTADDIALNLDINLV